MKHQLLPFTALIFFAALLLRYPAESAAAAKDGLAVCYTLIIPSLFPFFVLSSLIISLTPSAIAARLFAPLMRPIFALSGPCIMPLLLGLIGGYPVGLRTTAQIYEIKGCTPNEAKRLAVFCNNCGPAFLLNVAGIGVFGSQEAGLLLLATHWLAAMLVGLLSRRLQGQGEKSFSYTQFESKGNHTPSLSSIFPDCVRDSFSATLNVCAFVTLFSVLIRLVTCTGALPIAAAALSQLLSCSPQLCQSAIIGFFELSTGISSLAPLYADPLALPLAAFILGWGSLSVHCQSLPFLNRCPDAKAPYFIGKLLQGTIAAGLAACLAPLLPEAGGAFQQAALWYSPATTLVQREILALFFLAGLFWLAEKKTGKPRPPGV